MTYPQANGLIISSSYNLVAHTFRDEYGKQFMTLRDKERKLGSTKRELQLLHKHLLEARPSRKAGGLELVSEAISHIKKDDLTSLKSVYRRMFEKIVIRPLEGKKVQLEFIFKDMATPPSGGVVTFCTAVGSPPFPTPHPLLVPPPNPELPTAGTRGVTH